MTPKVTTDSRIPAHPKKQKRDTQSSDLFPGRYMVFGRRRVRDGCWEEAVCAREDCRGDIHASHRGQHIIVVVVIFFSFFFLSPFLDFLLPPCLPPSLLFSLPAYERLCPCNAPTNASNLRHAHSSAVQSTHALSETVATLRRCCTFGGRQSSGQKAFTQPPLNSASISYDRAWCSSHLFARARLTC